MNTNIIYGILTQIKNINNNVVGSIEYLKYRKGERGIVVI